MDSVSDSLGSRDRGEARDYRRIEVITGSSRRRRWSIGQKAALVEESFRPGINVSALARRAGVNRGLLQTWRREAILAMPPAPTFVPVRIDNEAENAPTSATSERPSRDLTSPPMEAASGTIEIVAGGMKIRVQGAVDPSALHAVLAHIRGWL